jgi:hypothetical protein
MHVPPPIVHLDSRCAMPTWPLPSSVPARVLIPNETPSGIMKHMGMTLYATECAASGMVPRRPA